MSTDQPHDRLEMDRTFPGTPEQLWDAWTTEQGLARWWWHTWPDTRYQVDGRPGGRYRIDAADHGIGVRGEYLVWDPFDRLTFSWIWIDDGTDGDTEQVEVTFVPEGEGTRVALVHTGPWTTAEPADNYRQGWDFVLDALAAEFTPASQG